MSEDVVGEVRGEAKSYFNSVDPSHDWLHVKRVENLSDKIAEKEDVDQKVVKLAALLHDIGREKESKGEIEDHSSWGAKKSKEILRSYGFKEELLEKVAHCVNSHRYSTGPEPETREAKVLCDADNLDAIGAVGVARTFSVGGEMGNPLADPDTPIEQDQTSTGENSLNHFYKKILNLKERMYTESGKEIAEERHDFTEEFVNRMEEEIRGNK